MIERLSNNIRRIKTSGKFSAVNKLDQAMQHLTYISETTQSNPMLFRLYDREKLAALIQFVKENTNAQNKE